MRAVLMCVALAKDVVVRWWQTSRHRQLCATTPPLVDLHRGTPVRWPFSVPPASRNADDSVSDRESTCTINPT